MTTPKPYVILQSNNRQEWLNQRRGYVTASDASRLKNPTQENLRKLYEEKQKFSSMFTGNAYTHWGNERESVIGEWVRENLTEEVWPNDKLLASTRYEGMAATPDMISLDGKISVQIKTVGISKSSKDINGFLREHPEYRDQMEWEMLTLGVEQCYLVWEERIGKPGGFLPGDIHHGIYKSDPMLRALLLEGLEKWQKFEIDEIEGAPDDFEIQWLVQERARLYREAAKLKALTKDNDGEIEKVDKKLLEKLGLDPVRRQFADGIVEVTEGRFSSRFDRKAFAADHPELERKYVKTSQGTPKLKFTPNNNDK